MTRKEEDGHDILKEGWALKSSKKAVRFNETEKRYLDQKFNLGKLSGQRFDATVNAKDLRYARNKDGTRKFEWVSEYLYSCQRVQSFFLRKSSKVRHREPEDYLDAENDDFVEAEDPVSVFSLLFTWLERYCHLFPYHLWYSTQVFTREKILPTCSVSSNVSSPSLTKSD